MKFFNKYLFISILLTPFFILIEKWLNIKLDLIGKIGYIAIAFLGVYIGEGLRFYYKFYWLDRIIHFLSGITFVSFGIALSKKIENLEIIPILVFSFTFSMCAHILWETGEFLIDKFFNTNHQRWKDDTNITVDLTKQPRGLVDTMMDGIMCLIGTAIACIAWWFVYVVY